VEIGEMIWSLLYFRKYEWNNEEKKM
jgi:hypothetical protein